MLENNVGLSDVLHEILSEDLLLDNTAIAQFESALTELSKTGTIEALTEGGVDLPNIEIVPSAKTDGQPGVLSPETNSLYLAGEYLSKLTENSQKSPKELSKEPQVATYDILGLDSGFPTSISSHENINSIPETNPVNPIRELHFDFSSQEFASKVSPGTLDSFSSDQPQRLIVLFDDSAVQSRVAQMRQLEGLASHEADSASIVEFKAQQYQGVEDRVLSSLDSNVTLLDSYSHLPLAFVEVDSAEGLSQLLQRSEVMKVYQDVKEFTQLNQSLPIINQPIAQAAGYIGNGTTIAVLDTGADPNAPGLVGRVVHSQDFAPDDGSVDANGHGTNVSAIAAGVASGAQIAALDVFNGGGAFVSDQIGAMNWSIANQATYNIVAMNMSLGGGYYTSPNTTDPRKIVIDNAKAAGISTVVAAGNDGFLDGLSNPAAIDGAVSVGAVYDYTGTYGTDAAEPDKVAIFSNSAPFLDLLAPGSRITAGGLSNFSGTSMAAPHVAGAFAVLSAAFPTETPDQLLARLKSTGASITDHRNGITTPRIDLAAALGLSTGITPVPLDYMTGFETGSLGSEWSNYTTFEGRVQVTNAYAKTGTSSLLLDDSVNGGAISTAAAILHLDASQFLNAQLDFSWLDLNDESNFGLDGVFISGDGGTTWTEVYSLTGGSSFSWTDASINLGNYLQPSTQDFQIKFQQYDNFSAPTDGVAIDDIKVTELVQATSLNYNQGFESGSFGLEWTKDVTQEGRVQVTDAYAASGSYSLLLDDAVNGGDTSTSAAILHVDGSDFLNARLNFKWLDLLDESNPGLDGVFVSEDNGTTWTEVYALTGGSSVSWTDASIDLWNYLQPSTDNFLIKFQQYDNFSAPTDGIAIDDIGLEEVVTAAVPDFKDSFESGSFGLEWTKETTNDGRVDITGAYAYKGTNSMLLDSSSNGIDYSTASAILHLDAHNFPGSDLLLSFRWLDLNDEYDVGQDGIFISDDGSVWHEVYAFDTGSSIDWTLGTIDLDQQAANYGLDLYNGNFQVKFQQYDNFSAPTDGIAVDFVKVTEV
ncbi:S8 family serine peptidase [Lusitaniella coriacea LEGE 07157]|uniref:S8 family serine peptidase n=1 Tax=Lusitaniella coriacea LEGE 07157 TaxID=945747 RepID=A0A8J7DZR6_9CYAN|nr:S8 family serine peptidase [Lusitaniella coriacea]MBE9116804.1 S8 family serine peptidase [Lusitaniella coriacea LEGE 07157]